MEPRLFESKREEAIMDWKMFQGRDNVWGLDKDPVDNVNESIRGLNLFNDNVGVPIETDRVCSQTFINLKL